MLRVLPVLVIVSLLTASPAAAQDEPVDVTLKVKNLGSSETIAALEKEFAGLGGVEKAQVRFISQMVNLRVKGGGKLKLSEVLEVIRKVGGEKGMELDYRGTFLKGRVRVSVEKPEEGAKAVGGVSGVRSCEAVEGGLDVVVKSVKGIRLEDVVKALNGGGFGDLEWGYAPPEGAGPKRHGRPVDVFGGGDKSADSAPRGRGLMGWSMGPTVPNRSSAVVPVVAVGKWLVAVDGDSDNSYGAVQQPDGKLSEWKTLNNWGYGKCFHGSGNVSFGQFAYNVGICGFVRRVRAMGDNVSRWEFPVPGNKIDPDGRKPRELVWGGAAGTSVGNKTYLYYLGGFEYAPPNRKPTDLDVVYYAEVTSGAALTEWKPTTALPYPVMSPTGVGYNGFIFVIGGDTKFVSPGGRHKEIHAAKVNPDGTIDRWAHVANLPRPAEGVIAFAYKDYLYVLGGESGKSLKECYRAPFGKDGRVGGWQPQPSLPEPAGGCQHGIIGNFVYVVGEIDKEKKSPCFISRID